MQDAVNDVEREFNLLVVATFRCDAPRDFRADDFVRALFAEKETG